MNGSDQILTGNFVKHNICFYWYLYITAMNNVTLQSSTGKFKHF